MARKIALKKYAGVYYTESEIRQWRERPDRCYWVAFKDSRTGKLRWERCGWASEGWTPEAAQKRRFELLEQDRVGEYKPKKERKLESLTLGELWQKHYLPWAKEHKKSWRDDLRYYRRHLEPRFADRPLSAISPLDLERLKVEMKKSVNRRGKPYAPATIKHVLVIVRRLYNLARKWGLYDGKSPVEAVTLPRLDNQVTEYLTQEEAARLLSTLETWPCRQTAALVKFALFTGLRRGELFKLTWQDVDLERGLITLRDPKGGRTETLPVSPQALEVLKTLERTSEYVFPGKDGGQRVSFWRPWEKIRKAAGLPETFRFHGLRHHYAATLVSAGVDLVAVQRLLTHKDFKTTQRYAHLAPGALREAALKSGELLTPVVAVRKQEEA